MNLLPKFFTLAALSLCYPSASAADQMLLHLKDGTIIRFDINSKPDITIEGNSISVGVSNYAIAEVDKYTFGNQSDISNINNDTDIIFDGSGRITVNTDLARSEIKIYSLDGTSYPLVFTESGSGITTDISGLPGGYYILKIGSKAIKIHHKK